MRVLQNEGSTKKSHSVTYAGHTLKKVAMLTKRNASITVSHLINVFSEQ